MGNWKDNLIEHNGKWCKKGKDGNCELFFMSDLEKLIRQIEQEAVNNYLSKK